MQQPVQSDTGTRDVTQKRWMKMMHSPMSSHRSSIGGYWSCLWAGERTHQSPEYKPWMLSRMRWDLRCNSSSSMSTCEQAICVRKVHLLMKDVALSWCKELKVANGKGIKKCFSWVSSKKHSKFCATTVQCVFVVLSLLVVHEQSETCTAWLSSEISRLTNTELCCQSR